MSEKDQEVKAVEVNPTTQRTEQNNDDEVEELSPSKV